MKTAELTTITDAAAELGIPRITFRKRYIKLGILPEIRIPHTPTGKGFTRAQMKRLRIELGKRRIAVSA